MKPIVDGVIAISFACGAAVAVLVVCIIAWNPALMGTVGVFAALVAGSTGMAIAWMTSEIDAWIDAHTPEEEDSYD